VAQLLDEERAWGVVDDAPYAAFAGEIERVKRELVTLIRDLHQREKKTVLWVHHRLDQCAAFSEKVCWVDKRSVQLRAISEIVS